MTKEDYFSAAGKKRKALEHSATVLVLVDFINPMMFSGAETLLRPALEAAQATAKLKKAFRVVVACLCMPTTTMASGDLTSKNFVRRARLFQEYEET